MKTTFASLNNSMSHYQAERIQNFGEQHPKFHSKEMKAWRKVMKNYTFIAETKDNVPIYWGKKDSSDPTSRDLSLWVAVGKPKKDGSNYRRVLPQDEVQSYKLDYNEWQTYIADKIKNTHSETIRISWGK